jgi:DNA-binding LacI/PurR family transcriptional regulator
VCVNDATAADLQLFFIRHGVKVPGDVRIVGFDDLPIDETLPAPLTTIRQNPSALAYESIRTMIDRIERPDMPAREILIRTDLVIRESCGSRL